MDGPSAKMATGGPRDGFRLVSNKYETEAVSECRDFIGRRDRRPQRIAVAPRPNASSARPEAERDPHLPGWYSGRRSLQRRPHPGMMVESVPRLLERGISLDRSSFRVCGPLR